MRAGTLHLALISLVAALPCVTTAAPRGVLPLPVSARPQGGGQKGGGWQEQGMLPVTFVHAEGQFKSLMAQRGWRFLHSVPITPGNTRTLYAWRRGNQETTLMLWRIDVGKTGYSWGVSSAKTSSAKAPRAKTK